MEIKKEWIEMFKNLEFDEIRDDEKELEEIMLDNILSHEGTMMKVDNYHKSGQKCAIVSVYENNILDGFVAPESKIKELFDFHNLNFTFNFYDIEDSICSIFVRDGRVSISVMGVSGDIGMF